MGCLLGGVFEASCVRELPGENPAPEARLYYPSRLVPSADGAYAWVVNTNFDQRFRAGWLTRVDVARALTLSRQQQPLSTALDEPLAVPSLGGQLLIDTQAQRGYLAHRGSGLITALDLSTESAGGPQLTCGKPSETQSGVAADTACDPTHIFNLRASVAKNFHLEDDPALDDFDDPYALTIFNNPIETSQRHVLAGLLESRRMAVLSDAPGGGLSLEGLVATDTSGVMALATSASGPLVAASRAPALGRFWPGGQRVASLLGMAQLDATMWQKPGELGQGSPPVYSLSGDLGTSRDEQERPQVAALAFLPNDGTRLVALTHAPDALVMLKLAAPPRSNLLGQAGPAVESGALAFTPLAAKALSQINPSSMTYLARPQGDLLVVASLVQDTLYFFDPSSDQLQLVHRMPLSGGLGPSDMSGVQVDGQTYLLVSTFFNHGLVLIDTSSPSFADFQVLSSFADENFRHAPRHR